MSHSQHTAQPFISRKIALRPFALLPALNNTNTGKQASTLMVKVTSAQAV